MGMNILFLFWIFYEFTLLTRFEQFEILMKIGCGNSKEFLLFDIPISANIFKYPWYVHKFN